MKDPLPNIIEVSSLQPIPPSLPELTGTRELTQKEVGYPESSASVLVAPRHPGLRQYNVFETVPVTVSTEVKPQEQAGSLRRYHPEPVPVTDSEQVSLHHALSRVTGTVETFPRFVHLSVLWLVINRAVFVLCMWKNERQSGYQMLSFNAGCTHLLLFYFLCMHLPLLTPPPAHFLGLYYVLISHFFSSQDNTYYFC